MIKIYDTEKILIKFGDKKNPFVEVDHVEFHNHRHHVTNNEVKYMVLNVEYDYMYIPIDEYQLEIRDDVCYIRAQVSDNRWEKEFYELSGVDYLVYDDEDDE